MNRQLDCVVVGYNECNFADMIERAEPFQQLSGGYRHLMVNSVPFQGRRGTYFDLLNAARTRAGFTGEPLHVARMPNLAVCCLVDSLRRRGLRTEFVNSFIHDRGHFEELLDERPSAVAITTTFYFEPSPIQDIVRFVRDRSPETTIVVGGPHIFNVCSDNAPAKQDLLLQEIGADVYVFDSQGEQTLATLCLELRSRRPQLNLVPNLLLPDGKGFHRTLRSQEHNKMDENPIRWSSFDSAFIRPAAQTRTARSCAYQCAFCRYPVMAGALDLMTVGTIEQELDALAAAGTEYLLFIDDTFNIPMPRFKDLCRLMIRKQYGFKWFSYFRCANADQECFDLMANAGCTGVFLGIESGDDRILKEMNKAATTAKYSNGIRELRARGIITFASFIVGFPSETEETAANTLQFIRDTQPTFYCLESFFYDRKVPIGRRDKEFDLSGEAYSWRHATMDWRTAADIVERGYRTISNSLFLPFYGFDLWSVAYLMSQGFSRATITDFLTVSSRLMLSGTDAAATVARAADEQRIVDMFRPSTRAMYAPAGAAL